jgi:hypothetical protein
MAHHLTGHPGDESVITTQAGKNLVDPERSFYRYRSHLCHSTDHLLIFLLQIIQPILRGFKVLLIVLPNGMIGTVFIASLRHNDNGLVNMSGLNEYLYNLFRNWNQQKKLEKSRIRVEQRGCPGDLMNEELST